MCYLVFSFLYIKSVFFIMFFNCCIELFDFFFLGIWVVFGYGFYLGEGRFESFDLVFFVIYFAFILTVTRLFNYIGLGVWRGFWCAEGFFGLLLSFVGFRVYSCFYKRWGWVRREDFVIFKRSRNSRNGFVLGGRCF